MGGLFSVYIVSALSLAFDELTVLSRHLLEALHGPAFYCSIGNNTLRIRFDLLDRLGRSSENDLADLLLRDLTARFVTFLINLRRNDEGLKIAEERPILGEEKHVDSIISSFEKQMADLWKPGGYERGGNTKTQGVLRGEFTIHDNLLPQFRHGIFAEPRTFRAWVRFSGPGPYITPDIDDPGFMSISIKLMDVPGPKLMDQEKHTQDFVVVSPPTFVTPDINANAQLQIESGKNAQIFYFLNSADRTSWI